MNKEDLKKALEYCINAKGMSDCSKCEFYMCITCRDELMKDALQLINEQEAEIERLKNLLEQSNAGIVNCSGCALEEQQAVQEFAEKLKDYLLLKMAYEYGDMADSTQYYTIDIDEFTDYIDELLKEYEK